MMPGHAVDQSMSSSPCSLALKKSRHRVETVTAF
jgi:hypothetical protein